MVIWLGEDDGQAKTMFTRLESLSWAARRIMMQNNITQAREIMSLKLKNSSNLRQVLQFALASVGYEEES